MKELIIDMEYRNMEMINMEEERHLRFLKKKERTRQEPSDFISKINVWIRHIPDREKKEKGSDNLFQQTADENFPNLWKELDPQNQAANLIT